MADRARGLDVGIGEPALVSAKQNCKYCPLKFFSASFTFEECNICSFRNKCKRSDKDNVPFIFEFTIWGDGDLACAFREGDKDRGR